MFSLNLTLHRMLLFERYISLSDKSKIKGTKSCISTDPLWLHQYCNFFSKTFYQLCWIISWLAALCPLLWAWYPMAEHREAEAVTKLYEDPNSLEVFQLHWHKAKTVNIPDLPSRDTRSFKPLMKQQRTQIWSCWLNVLLATTSTSGSEKHSFQENEDWEEKNKTIAFQHNLYMKRSFY